ncbi:hypothetical protein B7R74_10425 [Yersinia pseudotuberculosis]|uniref:Uncharacterized protein n=1 Tax=Yersinia pseudotuberculosis TaxID=633 RepID=A0A0T9JL26_YERPU|nr:hypothetical protein [Yersinia pseudotuberculosis]PSH21226.1 hypothetical protein B7R74_10425 [Yersinia pseudotuberculosis]CNC92651.1 Uncharacterised protein [Yersinia pseudotuberculosis]SUP86585.1 Uncharacterised protein [Yersinia pseudotuberculosis]
MRPIITQTVQPVTSMYPSLPKAFIQDKVMLSLHNKAALDSTIKGDAVRALLLHAYVDIKGNEVERRTTAVGIQKLYEEVLQELLYQDPKCISVMISHTANPPTPLSIASPERVMQMMHQNIQQDIASQKTITDRTQTLHNLLSYKNQFQYKAIYDQPRLKPEENYNFKMVNDVHENLHSIQTDSCCKAGALTGATYFLQDSPGEIHVFGIRITQANEESGKVELFQGLKSDVQTNNKLDSLYLLLRGNSHQFPDDISSSVG